MLGHLYQNNLEKWLNCMLLGPAQTYYIRNRIWEVNTITSYCNFCLFVFCLVLFSTAEIIKQSPVSSQVLHFIEKKFGLQSGIHQEKRNHSMYSCYTGLYLDVKLEKHKKLPNYYVLREERLEKLSPASKQPIIKKLTWSLLQMLPPTPAHMSVHNCPWRQWTIPVFHSRIHANVSLPDS